MSDTLIFNHPIGLETANGHYVYVIAEIEAIGGYDGIGPYEYWGSMCFDKGQHQWEEFHLLNWDYDPCEDEGTRLKYPREQVQKALEDYMESQTDALSDAAYAHSE